MTAQQLKDDHRQYLKKLRAAAKSQGMKSESQKNREFLRSQDRDGVSCSCHLKEQVTGPVPHCCPVHDGDYSSFLAAHNCD